MMAYGAKDLGLSLTSAIVAVVAYHIASRVIGGYALLVVISGLISAYLSLVYFLAWFEQLGSERKHADIKLHIDELIQSLGGGAVQGINPRTLKKLYKERNFAAMLGWIKNSMRLDLRIGLRVVEDDKHKRPMWIEWTNRIPSIGTMDFRSTRVIVSATHDVLSKPFNWIVAGFAHELAHVVLSSLNHPLQENEKAVDLTAMILGYKKFIMTAYRTTTEWVDINRTMNRTELLGYLTIAERRFAAAYIEKLRRKRAAIVREPCKQI